AGSGRAQFQRLLDTLLDASVVFTYVTRDVDLIPPRILPPQALVVALSPLLDARFVRAATDLAARRFDLVVLAVSPVAAARGGVRRAPPPAPARPLRAPRARSGGAPLRPRRARGVAGGGGACRRAPGPRRRPRPTAVGPGAPRAARRAAPQ